MRSWRTKISTLQKLGRGSLKEKSFARRLSDQYPEKRTTPIIKRQCPIPLREQGKRSRLSTGKKGIRMKLGALIANTCNGFLLSSVRDGRLQEKNGSEGLSRSGLCRRVSTRTAEQSVWEETADLSGERSWISSRSGVLAAWIAVLRSAGSVGFISDTLSLYAMTSRQIRLAMSFFSALAAILSKLGGSTLLLASGSSFGWNRSA